MDWEGALRLESNTCAAEAREAAPFVGQSYGSPALTDQTANRSGESSAWNEESSGLSVGDQDWTHAESLSQSAAKRGRWSSAWGEWQSGGSWSPSDRSCSQTKASAQNQVQ